MNERKMLDIVELWGTVNEEGCWDLGSLRHLLFMVIHAPSQGSRFYSCLLWCREARVHINVVVVHWNNEENTNVEMHIGATAGCACTRTAGLILQCDCLFAGSVGAHGALRECQSGPQAIAVAQDPCLSTNPRWLSCITRCCGSKLHDKVTKHRLAQSVKQCKILALKTSVKKIMFSFLRRSLLNISFPFLSLFPPLCSYIPLHLHLGRAFLGWYILWIKGLLRKFPIYFDFLPLYFLLELPVPRVSEGLRLFSQGKLLI